MGQNVAKKAQKELHEQYASQVPQELKDIKSGKFDKLMQQDA